MELNTLSPLLIPAKSAVLLVFLPAASSPDSIRQRASLTRLIDPLQQQFNGRVRILKIDENTYPEVVQSFSVKAFPTFVLVQQGVELWRQEGLSPDEYTPTALSERINTH
jgi:thioredoxin-like negative regulator of GroEL